MKERERVNEVEKKRGTAIDRQRERNRQTDRDKKRDRQAKRRRQEESVKERDSMFSIYLYFSCFNVSCSHH